jgi:hypothetical protein
MGDAEFDTWDSGFHPTFQFSTPLDVGTGKRVSYQSKERQILVWVSFGGVATSSKKTRKY